MTETIWMADNPPSRKWPIYTRGNVGEVFPEPVRPLTWELVGHQAELGWRDAYRDFGLVDRDDFGDEDWIVLGIFGSYCYLNASYIRMVGVRAPGGSVEAMDLQFFGESEAPPYVPRKGDKSLGATLRLTRQVLKVLGAREIPELEEDKRLVEHLAAEAPGSEATDEELLDFFVAYGSRFRELFRRHILTTFRGTVGAGLVTDLATKAGHEDKLTTLLGGIGQVESALPAQTLWRLGRRVATSPALTSAFDAGVAGLAERLDLGGETPPGDPQVAAFKRDFAEFLDRFGSRGPNEWELATDTWGLRPEMALAAIDRMRLADESHDPGARLSSLESRRREATEEVRRALNRFDRFQFDKALRSATLFSQGRERSKTTVIRAHHVVRLVLLELCRRASERGGPPDPWDGTFLNIEEFRSYLDDPAPFLERIAERRAKAEKLASLVPPFVFEGQQPPLSEWTPRRRDRDQVAAGTTLQGIPGCPGTATGRARVVMDASDPGALGPGDVLVAPITDPSWTPLFLAAEAVVVDVGAVMSHAVIVSRELGIPCVVSVTDATATIPDGALVSVDGATGRVTVLEEP